jgi:hypothetical protein
VQSGANFDDDAGQAGRSVARIGRESRIFSCGEPADAKPASPRTTGNTADQTRLKPCRRKPFDVWKELELESQKGNPGLVRSVPNAHGTWRLMPTEIVVLLELTFVKTILST